MNRADTQRKKKIAYIVTVGMTVRAFFVPQLKALARNGFDVTVICSPDETLGSLLGAEIRYLPVTIPRGISLFGMLRAIRELGELFERERFDLIQYSTPNAAFCAAWAGKRAGVRLRIYHLMGLRYLSAKGLLRPLLKAAEKLCCRGSTQIECVSRSNLDFGVKEGLFLREKACVVWNGSSGGVDLRLFDGSRREEYRREVRRQYGLGADDFVFGFVGRITRDKGVNELLRAYEGLGGGRLLLVGQIEGEETLDRSLLDAARKDPRVVFTGQLSEDAVARCYAAMDLLLLPSYREGFGNVVIEAAAMGTGAIVSDIPGPIDAIKDGVTGVRVPVGDSAALSGRMRECLEGKLTLRSEDCMAFARACFDSERLCELIVERKRALLEE